MNNLNISRKQGFESFGETGFNPVIAGALADKNDIKCWKELDAVVWRNVRNALIKSGLTQILCRMMHCEWSEVVDEVYSMMKVRLLKNDMECLKKFVNKDVEEFDRWMSKSCWGECHHLYKKYEREAEKTVSISDDWDLADPLSEEDGKDGYLRVHLDEIVEKVLDGDCLRVVQAVIDPEQNKVSQAEKAEALGMDLFRFRNLYTKAKRQLENHWRQCA